MVKTQAENVRRGKRWLILALVILASGALVALILWLPSNSPGKTTAATPGTAAADAHIAVDVRWIRRELTAAEAADYLGDAACAPCHPSVALHQAATHHAHTLRPVTLTEDGANFETSQTFSDPNFQCVYKPSVANGACWIGSYGSEGNTVLPAHWAIGSGKDARTFLSQTPQAGWTVMRLTYYTGARRWEFTPAQGPGSQTATVIGVPQSDAALVNCLSCHVTVLREGPGGPDVAHSLVGVGCERCHGPGRAHVEAVHHSVGRPADLRLEDLKKASPQYITDLCGACHRTAENTPDGDPHTENDLARFEGAALARSACYLRSGTLSCITCHNPHTDADPSPAHNDRVCLRCHAGTQPVSVPAGAQGKVCTVSAHTGCTDCHMPRQSIAGIPFAHYTNHWIKVWQTASPSQKGVGTQSTTEP